MVTEELLIDNADVRVLKITIPPGETQLPVDPRNKRVIVALTPHHSHRHVKKPGSDDNETAAGEMIQRHIGETVFREASRHAITNLSNQTQVSIVIELKDMTP